MLHRAKSLNLEYIRSKPISKFFNLSFMSSNIDEILTKIELGAVLSLEEEKLYLMNILGLSSEEADRVIAIAINEDRRTYQPLSD